MKQRFIDEVGLAHAFSKLKSEIDSKADPSGLVKKSGDTMTGALKAPELSTDNATIGTELVYDSVNDADRELASISLTESDDHGNYSVKMGFDPKYEEESADSVTHPAIKFERDGIVTKITSPIASRALGGGSGGLLVLENDEDGNILDVRVNGVAAPINNTDAANKKYVDDAVSPVDARVAANTNAIAVLNGTGAGSVSKAVSDAVSPVDARVSAIEEDCIKASELVALTESEIDSIWANA